MLLQDAKGVIACWQAMAPFVSIFYCFALYYVGDVTIIIDIVDLKSYRSVAKHCSVRPAHANLLYFNHIVSLDIMYFYRV